MRYCPVAANIATGSSCALGQSSNRHTLSWSGECSSVRELWLLPLPPCGSGNRTLLCREGGSQVSKSFTFSTLANVTARHGAACEYEEEEA